MLTRLSQGGGYVFGFPEMHGSLYLQFVEVGITVFTPKYRFSPEYIFPAGASRTLLLRRISILTCMNAAHDDGVAAWDWITSGGGKKYGVEASKFAMGGTSAGGGLAASAALRLRDTASSVQPVALILNIPWLAKAPLDEKPIPGEDSWTSVKFDRIWCVATLESVRSRLLTRSEKVTRERCLRHECILPARNEGP